MYFVSDIVMSFENNKMNKFSCHVCSQATSSLSAKTDPSESTTCVVLSSDSFLFSKHLMSVCRVAGTVMAVKVQTYLSLGCAS